MYPYSSTTLAETAEVSQGEAHQDAVEAQVQIILSELELLPAEVQLAVYTRLLNGLTAKLTSAVVSKAITAAKTDTGSDRKKAGGGRGRSASRATANSDVPRADSLLRQLNDSTDPIEAWQRFGGSAADVFDVLKQEPTGALEAMLAHRNMPTGRKPRGKSREKLAEAIAERLERHFRGY